MNEQATRYSIELTIYHLSRERFSPRVILTPSRKSGYVRVSVERCAYFDMIEQRALFTEPMHKIIPAHRANDRVEHDTIAYEYLATMREATL